ncbi:MAG TPA: hypothetical protein VL200_03225 [Lacunisphaera sp.]|jgi:hypothetical protein|nr:hypothetical protein [Lacunisphaera sp.]
MRSLAKGTSHRSVLATVSYRPNLPAVDPNSKLAKVRDAMATGDWDLAIRLAARFRSLGEYGEAIKRGKEAMDNPELYQQLGRNLTQIKDEAIEALKKKYNLSWDAAMKSRKR